MSDVNFEDILDEYGKVTVKILECDEQLESLQAQEFIVRAKIKNSKL